MLIRLLATVVVLGFALPAAALAPVVCTEVAKVCSTTRSVCTVDGDCRSTETCVDADPVTGNPVQRCPYTGVGAFGPNNAYDGDFSRCTIDQGCIASDGLACP